MRSPGRIPTTDEAVEASVACGRAIGLRVERPEVIAEGYSVRVRLHPAPMVTRVVTLGQVLRGDPLPWLRREVDVARHLARTPDLVVPGWDDPGPHDVDGVPVSLWRWVEPDRQADDVAPHVYGPALARLHAALLDYSADLPPLVGPLTDVATALERSDDAVLHAAAEVLVPLARSWPRRPLHGDAHPGNLLLTTEGPRWLDLEDVCVGPVEWDLASLRLGEDAVAAYPGPLDRDRLEECRDLRRLQVLASVLVGAAEGDAGVVDDEARTLAEDLRVALRRRL